MNGRLGPGGPPVAPLGLGLAAVGRPAYLNLGHGDDLAGTTTVEGLRARTHELLDLAHERGITYLDVARSYGRAEEFLASWLQARQLDPGALAIGSKWGYAYVGGWRLDATTHEVKDHSVDALRTQWEESRGLLGRHLDLYQLHSATFDTGVLRDRSVLDELARLRADHGVAVGVTVSGPDQRDLVRAAMEVDYDGSFLFTTVQATWNLLERSVEPALEEAHHEGLGVIVKEALANGRLSARGAEAGPAGPLGELADDTDAPPDVLALAAALARPWRTVVLSGAATLEQLSSNLEALEVGWDASWDARLAPLAAEDRAAYWARRSGTPWT